jgi:hypothetical protein
VHDALMLCVFALCLPEMFVSCSVPYILQQRQADWCHIEWACWHALEAAVRKHSPTYAAVCLHLQVILCRLRLGGWATQLDNGKGACSR